MYEGIFFKLSFFIDVDLSHMFMNLVAYNKTYFISLHCK